LTGFSGAQIPSFTPENGFWQASVSFHHRWLNGSAWFAALSFSLLSPTTDPVLAEVWRIKEEIAAEHGYDVD
jgi:hypothetical protein